MKNLDHLKDPYNFFVDFVVEVVFNDQQRQEYKKINEACGNCFLLAKQNNLDGAQKCFEESTLLFQSSQNKHWLAALCLPNISYYEYKIGGYETAIYRTNQIISSLKHLRKSTYQYLFFFEIQQYHNLSRVYFSINNISLAVTQGAQCLLSIAEHAKAFKGNNNLIYGVPEIDLYKISQYEMTIQVLSETCDKIIFHGRNDLNQLQDWLKNFIKQLLVLDFTSMSPAPRYAAIDEFIELIYRVLTNDYDEFQANVLVFAENPHANKTLLKVLFRCINSTLTAA